VRVPNAKRKGSPGGRLLTLTPEEYYKILKFHLKQYNLDLDCSMKRKKKFSFKKKAKQFVVLNDKEEGEWFHGLALYIKTYGHENSELSATNNKILFLQKEFTEFRIFPHKARTLGKKQSTCIDLSNTLWSH
jgi:hypothetical protein